MKNRRVKKDLQASLVLFVLFIVLIILLKTVDVEPLGPQNSEVGLATLNWAVHHVLGDHLVWYNITDILGKIALLTAFGFACLGLYQWIKRKDIRKVDLDILLLGGFYGLVILFYIFFEIFVVNYRPVILETELEASFPSSHTMVTLFIMGSAIYQCKRRIRNKMIKNILISICFLIMVVTVAGRLISGVHWFTDIIGGLLLGFSLIYLYRAAVRYTDLILKSRQKKNA